VKDPYHQLELNTTLHFLEKYLPSKGLVLDAGGGPGRYTIELAKRGYDVVLLDLTPELLAKAKRQISRAKVRDKVQQIVEGSIEDLSMFEANSFDGVLSLGGPLGHLLDASQREVAVEELVRVAKPRAPIFVSVISRIALFRTALVTFPEELGQIPDVYTKILETGRYEGGHGFTAAHFFLPEELKTLFQQRQIEVLEMVGLEGLASGHRRKLNRVARHLPEPWKLWQKIHLATCNHPSVVATSEHFMIIGRK
jgi:SAM-dependent methyltransferase